MGIISCKYDLDNLLLMCIELNGTDLHLSVGAFPAVRLQGRVEYLDTKGRVTVEDTKTIVAAIINATKLRELEKNNNCTFSYSLAGSGRFRVNVFVQRGSYSLSFRIGNFYCPTKEQLRLPEEIDGIFNIKSGLIIVSGEKSCGKTSTCAYLIDTIRQTKSYYIDTIEDPIEYLFRHDKSVVNQMEVGIDVDDTMTGLKISSRNYADVIFIGSLLTKDIISYILEAARAGRIIIAVTEVEGVEDIIKRLLNVFPIEQSNYARTLLSHSLKCIVSQQLIPDKDGKSLPLCEVLYGIKAITNLIKENKISQIDKVISTGAHFNMLSKDNHIAKLYKDGLISIETAKNFADNWNMVSQKLSQK